MRWTRHIVSILAISYLSSLPLSSTSNHLLQHLLRSALIKIPFHHISTPINQNISNMFDQDTKSSHAGMPRRPTTANTLPRIQTEFPPTYEAQVNHHLRAFNQLEGQIGAGSYNQAPQQGTVVILTRKKKIIVAIIASVLLICIAAMTALLVTSLHRHDSTAQQNLPSDSDQTRRTPLTENVAITTVFVTVTTKVTPTTLITSTTSIKPTSALAALSSYESALSSIESSIISSISAGMLPPPSTSVIATSSSTTPPPPPPTTPTPKPTTSSTSNHRTHVVCWGYWANYCTKV